jgi:hypothetical protein
VQSALQVTSAVSIDAHLPKTNSDYRSSPPILVTQPSASVFLVGRKTAWAPSMTGLISKLGIEPIFISLARTVSKDVQERAFTLVLLDSSVPSEWRKFLVSDLVGARATLFYVYLVEAGCWWLPALRNGEDCHGAPAFRAGDFLRELERLLQRAQERAGPTLR